MTLEDNIKAFANLGNFLAQLPAQDLDEICRQAHAHNNWFTEDNVGWAIGQWATLLTTQNLKAWTASYSLPKSKKVGVVMAGNIPLVGFHDLLSVLILGHQLQAKLSHKDSFLMRLVIDFLQKNTHFQIEIVEQLKNIEAVIATGSDQSARYFEYYFAKYPHIIRQNRNSCAVLHGQESSQDLKDLGKDVFTYFGLGCRNVSKVYLPVDYKVEKIFDAFEQDFAQVLSNHKYANNYEYSRAIYLINHVPCLDNGYLLLTPSTDLVAPTGVLYYEFYQSDEDLAAKIFVNQEKIQCIVSQNAYYPNSIPLGTSQQPQLWDYADNVNTLDFLAHI